MGIATCTAPLSSEKPLSISTRSVVHLSVYGGESNIVGFAYVDIGGNGFFVENATAWLDADVHGTVDCAVYGPGPCYVKYGGQLLLIGGGGVSWTNSLLVTGGLFLEHATTGTKYTPGTPGVFTDGVAINVTELDAFGGIQNIPITGSRYAVVT